MDRRFLATLVAAGVLLFCGCSSTKQVDVQGDAFTTAEEDARDGLRVKGYVLVDGSYHEYAGSVRLAAPDTLEFRPRVARDWAWGGSGPTRAPGSFRIPRDSVDTIHMSKTSAAGMVLSGVVVTTAILIAIVFAESCPFIYSHDGERFVLDGEPYGGATMKSLERTDWSELEHLRSSGGSYRLLLTNEMDEAQHTNSLSLRVVDHAPGTTVVMDKEGAPHAFRSLVPLLAARDDTGRDLLRWLRDDDPVAWNPDLKRLAGLDSLEDTRQHITLEFPRPRDADRGYLVARVSTHPWGSHMIRTMLGMRGNRVRDFYAAINGSDEFRSQLLAWNAREELFQLFPEVETKGGEWVRQDYIPAGGPVVSESRAIPLDWSGVSGETIRMRIHPPIGFWSLNSFHLAWEEGETRVTTLAPVRAGGGTEAQVVATLLEDDERYLDFPRTGDRAEVVFRAPAERPGLRRTIFARTRGWYELHLHDLGSPDVGGIARLTVEPGYAVRRALDEYEAYQRTGVLLGARRPEAPARR